MQQDRSSKTFIGPLPQIAKLHTQTHPRTALDLELTVLDGRVYFGQYSPLVASHLDSHMRYTVKVDDVEIICDVAKASLHYYHNLNSNHHVALMTEVLGEVLKPVGQNLTAEEPATIIVDEDAPLGISIYNSSSRRLHPNLFYFDPTNLTIGEIPTSLSILKHFGYRLL
ncbi:hypothetical protein CVT25_001762 [Psilocybe cyanescens]|uniref:Uncharacterized protein n=1 Tax=Psilocybe cyanescens TaxID=93625 RepID=A0A409VYH7_PSICY|nr:hypothetical protein CVT25_001762 [Psilocybe cyanescens]